MSVEFWQHELEAMTLEELREFATMTPDEVATLGDISLDDALTFTTLAENIYGRRSERDRAEQEEWRRREASRLSPEERVRAVRSANRQRPVLGRDVGV